MPSQYIIVADKLSGDDIKFSATSDLLFDNVWKIRINNCEAVILN